MLNSYLPMHANDIKTNAINGLCLNLKIAGIARIARITRIATLSPKISRLLRCHYV